MTDNDTRLDRLAAGLPRELTPERDLWPEIAAALATADSTPRGGWSWPLRIAAAGLLMASSSLVTVLVIKTGAPQAPAVATVVPAPSGTLPAQRLETREDLVRQAGAQLDRLSPATRIVVEANLAEIRAGLAAIDAALADDPGNALLQQLLFSTYQQELDVLREINRLTEGYGDGVSI